MIRSARILTLEDSVRGLSLARTNISIFLLDSFAGQRPMASEPRVALKRKKKKYIVVSWLSMSTRVIFVVLKVKNQQAEIFQSKFDF